MLHKQNTKSEYDMMKRKLTKKSYILREENHFLSKSLGEFLSNSLKLFLLVHQDEHCQYLVYQHHQVL